MSIRLVISLGTRFGNLTVTGEGGYKSLSNGQTKRMLTCRCDCGAEVTTYMDSLRRGLTKSCGCLRKTKVRETAPIGKQFERLTVIGEAFTRSKPNGKLYRIMRCKCSCGNSTDVSLDNLKSGTTKSCGCLRTELSKTHGQTGRGKLPGNYGLWCGIKQRCGSGKARQAKNYAGRGITMYYPWVDDFEAFDWYLKTHLGTRPEGHSLDRINNDGNYEPDNLRWATQEQQCNNTRNNVWLVWQGERKTIAQWARYLGVSRKKLNYWLGKAGWAPESALAYLSTIGGYQCKKD